MPKIYVADVQGVTVAASTAETLIQLRGTTNSIDFEIVRLILSCNSNTAGDNPFEWELARQTTDGTTGSTPDEDKFDTDQNNAQVSAHSNFSAEPTKGDVLASGYLEPQGVPLVLPFDYGERPIIRANERVGLIVTPGASITSAVFNATMHWTE